MSNPNATDPLRRPTEEETQAALAKTKDTGRTIEDAERIAKELSGK